MDPRIKRSRALIEQAFLELLGERSLRELTVGDIVERAEVNRSTFYAHFTDKYDLFDALIRRTFAETLAGYLAAEADFSAQHLRALIQALCAYFVYLNSQCPPGERQFRPIVEGQVQALLYERLLRWLPHAPAVALFVSWALFGSCLQRVGAAPLQDLGPLQQDLFALSYPLMAEGL